MTLGQPEQVSDLSKPSHLPGPQSKQQKDVPTRDATFMTVLGLCTSRLPPCLTRGLFDKVVQTAMALMTPFFPP